MNSMKHYPPILATLLSLLIPMKSWGGDLGKGVNAYSNGDYATALKEWTPLAEQGNADAQYLLGLLYQGGIGVPQDDKTASKWFTLSAEQGNAHAQTEIGKMYNNGTGVPQDYKTALKWFILGSEQGNTMAQINLGSMYEYGMAIHQDYVKAHMWYNIGASSGTDFYKMLRDDMAKKMTPSQIEKAQELARECVAKDYKGC